ncbi:MAG TPA: AraC family transcriptional regulator [Burkholderiaceae bacterium]
MSSIRHGDALASSALPAGVVSFSTDDVPALNRLDYWMTHAYRAVEAHPARDIALRGRVNAFGSADTGQFVQCESTPVQTRMTARRLRAQLSDEHIAICLIHCGNFQVESADGAQVGMRAGDLFMFDCGQPMSAHWSNSITSYLRLPRILVRHALGRDPSVFCEVLSPLSDHGLAPFLASQLRMLAAHGSTLPAKDRQVVLHTAVELSLKMLASYFGVAKDGVATRADKLQAAYQYMHQHSPHHDLTPQTLAKALQCSRAQLYRLFDMEPLSVKAALREIRLLHSMDMLRQAGPGVNVGAVADACGFSDASVFGKLFRQRFGATPGDVARGRAAPELHPASHA